MDDDTLPLAERIEVEKRVTLRGLEQLEELRAAIADAYAAGGLEVQFDPASTPRWVDYLAVATPNAIEQGLKGAAIGLALGALFGAPKEGAVFGSVIGAARGARAGIDKVQRGWRIRVTEQGGVPWALVEWAT